MFYGKTCAAVFCFSREEKKNRGVLGVFLEQKTGVCSVRFSGADFAAAVLLLSRNFIQPIFPASRETDLCGGSKREFF